MQTIITAGAISSVLGCFALFLLVLKWIDFPVTFVTVIFSSFVLSFALRPHLLVTDKLKIGRTPAFMLIIVAIIAILVLIGALVVPVVSGQVQDIVTKLPTQLPVLWQQIETAIARHNPAIASSLNTYVQAHLSFSTSYLAYFGNFADTATGLLSSFASFGGYGLMILIFTMILISDDNLPRALVERIFYNQREAIMKTFERARGDIGHWASAQLFVSSLIGSLLAFLLFLGGVPFAGAVGFIYVMVDLIPFGNTLALVVAILGVLINISLEHMYHSLYQGIYAFVVWLVLAQIESNWLQPRVMKRVLHIHPILTLSFVFLGLSMNGIVGGLLSIPILLVARAVFESVVVDNRPAEAVASPTAPSVPAAAAALPASASKAWWPKFMRKG
jgi:predicted PurR-regulated permease PerM